LRASFAGSAFISQKMQMSLLKLPPVEARYLLRQGLHNLSNLGSSEM
jgi:hypothetical protein